MYHSRFNDEWTQYLLERRGHKKPPIDRGIYVYGFGKVIRTHTRLSQSGKEEPAETDGQVRVQFDCGITATFNSLQSLTVVHDKKAFLKELLNDYPDCPMYGRNCKVCKKPLTNFNKLPKRIKESEAYLAGVAEASKINKFGFIYPDWKIFPKDRPPQEPATAEYYALHYALFDYEAAEVTDVDEDSTVYYPDTNPAVKEIYKLPRFYKSDVGRVFLHNDGSYGSVREVLSKETAMVMMPDGQREVNFDDGFVLTPWSLIEVMPVPQNVAITDNQGRTICVFCGALAPAIVKGGVNFTCVECHHVRLDKPFDRDMIHVECSKTNHEFSPDELASWTRDPVRDRAGLTREILSAVLPKLSLAKVIAQYQKRYAGLVFTDSPTDEFFYQNRNIILKVERRSGRPWLVVKRAHKYKKIWITHTDLVGAPVRLTSDDTDTLDFQVYSNDKQHFHNVMPDGSETEHMEDPTQRFTQSLISDDLTTSKATSETLKGTHQIQLEDPKHQAHSRNVPSRQMPEWWDDLETLLETCRNPDMKRTILTSFFNLGMTDREIADANGWRYDVVRTQRQRLLKMAPEIIKAAKKAA